MNGPTIPKLAVAVAVSLAVGYAVGRYRHESVWRDRDGTVLRETTLRGNK